MYLKKFLKPNLKKSLVALAISFPAIFGLISLFFKFGLLSPKFLYLNEWIIVSHGIINRVLYSLSTILCELGNCSNFFARMFGYLVFILISYALSCLIVLGWDKIFSYFGEKARIFKIIILIILLISILGLLILWPIVSYSFINVEKVTSTAILKENISCGEKKVLQELTIKNNSIFPIDYELPDITTCVYDSEGNLAPKGYSIFYGYKSGDFVRDVDKYHRNVVYIKPKEEIKIYLQRFGRGLNGVSMEVCWEPSAEDLKLLNEFDEILLISNVGFDNIDYCSKITEEDIVNAKKIRIAQELSSSDISLSVEKTETEFEDKIVAIKERALAKNNIEICDEMIEVYEKEKQRILSDKESSLTSEGLSAGNYLTASKIFRNNYNICVTNISVVLNNLSLCEKIDGRYGSGRENCAEKVLLENLKECKKLQDGYTKKNCIQNTAYETNNVELCILIGDDDCIRTIAFKNKDITLCEEMFDGGFAGDCVYDIMKILKDSALCETLERTFSKRRCKEAIEE